MDTIFGRSVPAAYIPLIERMRFYIEPEISCSRFFGNACFTDESIARFRQTGDSRDLEKTEMGTFIAERLEGGTFVDIPCGRHDLREQDTDFDMTVLASALGARAYIEVDLTADVLRDRVPDTIDVLDGGRYRLTQKPGPSAVRHAHGMTVTTMQDDLLGFISKMPPAPSPKALYLSAIQPDADFLRQHEETAVSYVTALYDECARVCEKGDLLILNSGAMLVAGIAESRHPSVYPALALVPRGFALMRRDAYDKVHVFVKE